MKKTFLLLCSLVSLTLIAQKPTPFQAKTADPAKVKSYLDFPAEGRNSKKGDGYSANVDLLNPKPKKVALVSFYLYDPACGKTTGGTYTGVATAACWRTSESVAQAQIDGFYNESLPVLKEQFTKYGMQLLTPDEFIDTDEKADFFYNFSQESARKEKTERTVRKSAGTTISSVAEASVSTLKISPAGKGYRAFFIANEDMTLSKSVNFMNMGILGANRKMTSSLGYELCKGLGVDAVVICYIVTRKLKQNKENYAVNAANIYMFGPNPMTTDPEDKNRGQFYCGVRYFTKPLIFQDAKLGTSYKNMGNVYQAISGRLSNYVINKVKK